MVSVVNDWNIEMGRACLVAWKKNMSFTTTVSFNSFSSYFLYLCYN